MKNTDEHSELRENAIELLMARFHQEEGNYQLCKDALIKLSSKNQEGFSRTMNFLINATLAHLNGLAEFGSNTEELIKTRTESFNIDQFNIRHRSNNGMKHFFHSLLLSDSMIISHLLNGNLANNYAINELQKSKGLLSAENIALSLSNLKFQEQSYNLGISQYEVNKALKEIEISSTDAANRMAFLNDLRMKNLKDEFELDKNRKDEYLKILRSNFQWDELILDEYIPEDSALIHMYEYKELESLKVSDLFRWEDVNNINNLNYLIIVSFADKESKLTHLRLETIPKIELDSTVDALLNLFYSKFPNKRKLEGHIASISKKLIEPIQHVLANKRKLFISPVGALTDLPFGILNYRDEYLIQTHSISYFNSIRELKFANNQNLKTADRYLVFSDPNFNSADENTENSENEFFEPSLEGNYYSATFRDNLDNFDFKRLKYSAEEAISIKHVLGDQVQILEGDEADENYLYESQDNIPASFIHFSTHAFYSNNFETDGSKFFYIENGLALKGAKYIRKYQPFNADDGFYNGTEISASNYHNTKCVILNACSTESGDYVYSEGRLSLRKAFQTAGAKSVISTQWPVSDKVASLIMVDFVRNLKKGQTASDSLRNAQLKILQTRGYANPFFWGGYLYNGDPNVTFLLNN